MPSKIKLFGLISFVSALLLSYSFRNDMNTDPVTHANSADALNGAWMLKENNREQVLIFIDDYFTHTTYSVADRKFISTSGGRYNLAADKLNVRFEFGAPDNSIVNTEKTFGWSVQGGKLTADLNGSKAVFTRIDNGTGPLAGNWQITGRMQGDKMNEMRPGARKTIKILSGSRFQWAAINTETKEFSGSGGGTYTFKDGKYTENIEFFSRDSSRVGAALSFDGSVENGNWIQRGLSSRGEKIHEVWSRHVQAR